MTRGGSPWLALTAALAAVAAVLAPLTVSAASATNDASTERERDASHQLRGDGPHGRELAPEGAPTTLSPTNAPTTHVQGECSPRTGMKKPECESLIATCARVDINMSWVGAGASSTRPTCRPDSRKKLTRQGCVENDGGCQCGSAGEYCGWACKERCHESPWCSWDASEKECFNTKNHKLGQRAAHCLPPP